MFLMLSLESSLIKHLPLGFLTKQRNFRVIFLARLYKNPSVEQPDSGALNGGK